MMALVHFAHLFTIIVLETAASPIAPEALPFPLGPVHTKSKHVSEVRFPEKVHVQEEPMQNIVMQRTRIPHMITSQQTPGQEIHVQQIPEQHTFVQPTPLQEITAQQIHTHSQVPMRKLIPTQQLMSLHNLMELQHQTELPIQQQQETSMQRLLPVPLQTFMQQASNKKHSITETNEKSTLPVSKRTFAINPLLMRQGYSDTPSLSDIYGQGSQGQYGYNPYTGKSNQYLTSVPIYGSQYTSVPLNALYNVMWQNGAMPMTYPMVYSDYQPTTDNEHMCTESTAITVLRRVSGEAKKPCQPDLSGIMRLILKWMLESQIQFSVPQNTVTVPLLCSHSAILSTESCTKCCRLGNPNYQISTSSIEGILVEDSSGNAYRKVQPHAHNSTEKTGDSGHGNDGCTPISPQCPLMKCVCCYPASAKVTVNVPPQTSANIDQFK